MFHNKFLNRKKSNQFQTFRSHTIAFEKIKLILINLRTVYILKLFRVCLYRMVIFSPNQVYSTSSKEFKKSIYNL